MLFFSLYILYFCMLNPSATQVVKSNFGPKSGHRKFMGSRFETYLQSLIAQPQIAKMPFVHSTSYYHFTQMVRTHALVTDECSIFKENLLYLYYGRPAYRVSKNVEGGDSAYHLPVCLVLKPESLGEVKRVYPFDSGAFKGGFFKRHIHEAIDMDNYLLENHLDSPLRVVSTFFGTNEKYYAGAVIEGLHIDGLEAEAYSYYKMLNDTGATFKGANDIVSDDRRYTIEAQSGTDINLIASKVLAVILPSAALQSSEIRSTIVRKWEATPIVYYTPKYSSPNDCYVHIWNKLRDFLKEREIL